MWVLVVYFLGHQTGFITKIEGFKTESTCIQAGKVMMEDNASYFHSSFNYKCIEVK